VRRGPKKAVRLSITALAAVLLVSPIASRQLTAVRVAAGDDLQRALDSARAGDTVLLARGATFRGNFVLPAHDGTAFVTVRTEGAGLPDEHTRTGPQFGGVLAVVQSPNTSPALRAARAAHHWRLENLEVGPNRLGEGNIIELGSDDQRTVEDIPHDIVLDRLYVHGDPLTGQKRAIALNSAATDILNSYIADIKAFGVDGQAIAGWNGPGPYRIENNYVEASGENILLGGADPTIDQMLPRDIIIRRNHVSRPVAWRDPILAAAPAQFRAHADTARGMLAAGKYTYRVVAERRVAGGDFAVSDASSAETELNETGSIALTWDAVADVTGYRVYRVGGDGGDRFWKVTSPTFTDSGDTGQAGSPPKRASAWTVKNLLELKNAVNVQIEGNVFEHHWPQAQSGYAILVTPRNQSGRAPWSRVENVRFANNIVRHVSAAINISGTDDEKPSGRTRSIAIENNLFDDIGGSWGSPGDFVQMGNAPSDIRIEGNTVAHTGRIISVYGKRFGVEVEGLVVRNNVLRYNKYGVIGANTGPGAGTFAAYFPDATFTGNVIAGGDGRGYPAGNTFIGADRFDALFVDRAGDDFRLKSDASRRAGAPGVDVDALNRATAGAVQPVRQPSERRSNQNHDHD